MIFSRIMKGKVSRLDIGDGLSIDADKLEGASQQRSDYSLESLTLRCLSVSAVGCGIVQFFFSATVHHSGK